MIKKLYSDTYFKKRYLNDNTRIKSFQKEKYFIKKYTSINKKVCDVGCSTGEFLKSIEWKGPKYGVEINKKAIREAKKNGINFNKDIRNTSNFFDVVIFRGTIQHLDDPFNYLAHTYSCLKKGGLVFFLATPNINSLHYKLFQDLPALDQKRNFYLPSKSSLINLMEIYNFKFIESEYPYLNSGYDKPLVNFLCFILKIFGLYKKDIPFPGNMMNLVFKKK
jgi:2-polyprenyl-3-methyl-5-hydroxy-6-metoxy-1,4-benzoquinol methylase